MMKILLVSGFLLFPAASAFADRYYDERLWTGLNGKTFRGTFHAVSADGTNVEFFTTLGKMTTVALSNLIPRDRELIINRDRQEPGPGVAPVGHPKAFKPESTPDRSLIPMLDPKPFNDDGNESIVSALWVSLLWWDRTKVLEVPKKGDFPRKAEWLHKELTRAVAAGGDRAATLEETKKGMEGYFRNDLKELATCRIFFEPGGVPATRLSSLARGPNVVILNTQMTYANSRKFTVCAAVESISDTGEFVIHVFGKRFTGSMVPMKDEKKAQPREVGYELVFNNRIDLPEYYARNDPKFYMRERWNGVLVLKPYVYLMPGKVSPPPPDEGFGPAMK